MTSENAQFHLESAMLFHCRGRSLQNDDRRLGEERERDASHVVAMAKERQVGLGATAQCAEVRVGV
jgi:hypothetical protein